MRVSNKHILIVALIFISLKTYAQEVRVVDNKGTIKNVKSTRVYTGAKPADADALIGDMYFDMYPSPTSIEIWDGTIWKVINNNTTHTGTAGSVFFAGATGDPDENNSELFWDTSNNNLHIGAFLTDRNSNKLNVRGTVRSTGYKAEPATANRPSYTFYNDVNTGMYRGTNIDELNFSTAGTNALSIDATQNISIPKNLSVIGTYADTSGDVGTNGQVLSSTSTGTNWISNPGWLTTGNSLTNPATNFLGTTDAQPLVLRTSNIEKLKIHETKGQVLINQALSFNNHPLVIRANGNDVLAFEDEFGDAKWHWNLLGNGLNFVESGVLDYRLFLENGGHVGINTNNPTEYLDVNGRLKVRTIDNGNINTDAIIVADATGVFKKITAATLSSNIYNNNGTLTGDRIITGASNSLSFNGLNALQLNSSDTQINSSNITQISGTNGIQLQHATTVQNNLTVTGNISVAGTYADTSSDVGLNGQVLSSTGTGTNWVSNPGWLTTGNSLTNPAINFLGTTDAQDLVFRTNNTEALRINQANQYVGIGIPGATSPLHIVKNVADGIGIIRVEGTEPDINFNDTDGGFNTFTFENAGVPKFAFGRKVTDDFYITRNNGAWDDDTFNILNSNGFVGLNTSAPSERLDIDGKLRIRDITTTTTVNDILTTSATGVVEKSKINFGGRWTNTDVSTNLNINNTDAPIFGSLDYSDDAILYTITGATTLTVAEAGRYDIRANISLINVDIPGTTTAAQNADRRTSVNSRIYVNGLPVGALAATGYIRYNSGHQQTSLHLNEILQLPANADITIVTFQEANSGPVQFSGTSESSVMINKLR